MERKKRRGEEWNGRRGVERRGEENCEDRVGFVIGKREGIGTRIGKESQDMKASDSSSASRGLFRIKNFTNSGIDQVKQNRDLV